MIKRLGKGICDLRLEIYILEKSILRLNMFKINKRYKFFILLRKKRKYIREQKYKFGCFYDKYGMWFFLFISLGSRFWGVGCYFGEIMFVV